MKLNKAVACKVLELVDAGLVNGLGVAEPGKMCVEAAVCYALGEPHGDKPSCVGSAVRAFKIRLNDSKWSSDAARTRGMRQLAIAQLGSDQIDQKEFGKIVALETIKQIVPVALRAAAKMVPNHKAALEAAAVGCEIVTDLIEGRKAALQGKAAAAAYAYADVYAAAAYAYADVYAAAAYAAAAADAYADADVYAAAAYAAAAADADADADVYAAAAYAAAAADADADAAAAYAAAAAGKSKGAIRDKILTISANIGLQALKTLKSQGCQWLDLAA